MRIALVSSAYRPLIAGVSVYTTQLAEGLAARGHTVHVLVPEQPDATPWGPATPTGKEQLAGVQVRRLARTSRLHRAIERLGRMRGGWRTSQLLLRLPGIKTRLPRSWGDRAASLLRRLDPDVVLVIDWSQPAVPRAIASCRGLTGARVGIPLLHTENPRTSAAGYDALFPRYDALILCTEHERAFVEVQLAGVPASSHPTLYVVSLGVDPRGFEHADGARLRARLRLGNAPVVGYVGRLEPAKGVTCLIAAMARVWHHHPGARLLLAGSRFPHESPIDRQVQDAIDSLSAEDRARVLFLEQFPDADKADVFAALDVLAMPSLAESFGLAYVEAWLCARPVIGADAGAASTVIRHGVDGLLVDARDPDDVARAIERLLADEASRASLGRAGQVRARAKLTTQRTVERTEAVCAEVVLRRRRAMLPTP